MKFLLTFLVVATLSGGALSAILPLHAVSERAPTIVSRAGWGAYPPTSTTPMRTPVTHVVIHHTYIPGACTTASACEATMRRIQDSHQVDNGWADIGYSFGVGGDGRAYEGRGWSNVGAHAPGYNDRSIGIVVIGDWTSSIPPANQLSVVKELIAYGVQLGRISSSYKLIGHRQAVSTDCPGNALYNEIKKWPNYSPAG